MSETSAATRAAGPREDDQVPVRPHRLLYVGHDASRTGAPVLGLTFLRWLVDQGDVDVDVFLLAGGPLASAHHDLAPTRVLRSGPPLVTHALTRLGMHPPILLPRASSQHRSRLILANTLATLGPAQCLAGRHDRLVCWVHELDGVADRILPPARRGQAIDSVAHFVTAGHRIAEMLQHRWGIAPERITAVDGFVEPVAPAGPARRRVDILGAGSTVPRKGLDAFFATVATLASHRPDLRAAWVGDRGQHSTFRSEIARDLARAPLAGRAELIHEVVDLEPWLRSTGILLHTAREDPFPLVVLEAGRRKVPVVTWDTGGAADLLRSAGLGHLVAPPGDLLGLARRVEALLDDPSAQNRAGQLLSQAVAERATARLAPLVWAACQASASP